MSLIDKKEFLRQVVRPALDALALRGGGADILVFGTELAESGGLKWIRQVGGPALGLGQVEPATHLDLWVNWLRFPKQAGIRAKILSEAVHQGRELMSKDVAASMSRILEPALVLGDGDSLAEALRYGAAVCRLIYRRVDDPLPNHRDPLALAAYHKTHYNTIAGKATIEKSIPWFRMAIEIGDDLDKESAG